MKIVLKLRQSPGLNERSVSTVQLFKVLGTMMSPRGYFHSDNLRFSQIHSETLAIDIDFPAATDYSAEL